MPKVEYNNSIDEQQSFLYLNRFHNEYRNNNDEIKYNDKQYGYTPRFNKRARVRRVESRVPLGTKENIGSTAVILASGVDGYGAKSMHDAYMFAIKADELKTRLSGGLIRRYVGRSTASEIMIVEDAKKRDLKSAIKDTEVKSIYVLAHSTYHSARLSDGSVDWYDVGMMVDGHQKNGVFANLGCGIVMDRGHDPIPLGRYVVSENGVLLGKEDIYATFEEMSDPSQYSVLAA